MGAPCAGQNGKQADLPVRRQATKAGDGGRTVGMHLAEHYAPGASSDGESDLPLCGRCAADEGKVGLLDLSCLHGAGEPFGSKGGACRQHDATRLAVKTCDGTEYVRGGAIAKGERVCQRVVVVPVRGMGGHIAAFCAYGDLYVLVQQRQRQVACHQIFVAPFVGQQKGEHVSRMKHGTHRYHFPVEGDAPLSALKGGKGAGGECQRFL